MTTLLTKKSLKKRIRPRLRIALQKRGRLNEPSVAFLSSLGIEIAPSGSSLIQQCDNFELDILYLRDDDIPEFVSRGVADFGIVGQNVLMEQDKNVTSLKKLDFGRCRLSIASPAYVTVKTSKDLNGLRIATTYPRILETYLQQENVTATIVEIGGSAEIAPELNLADVICDIVQTGKTLRAHNLREALTILDSQAMLITSARDSAQKRGFINLCSKT
jgi:ATP phosphoribosyltransferase